MKNELKKQCGVFAVLCVLAVFFSGSCATRAIVDTMRRGAGEHLGTVSAQAAVSENRTTGEITGDTLKYGYIDRVTAGGVADRRSGGNPGKNAVPKGAADKALANALYEIIQQAREKGGDAVTDIITEIDKQYDPHTQTETATAKVSAQAVKMPQ